MDSHQRLFLAITWKSASAANQHSTRRSGKFYNVEPIAHWSHSSLASPYPEAYSEYVDSGPHLGFCTAPGDRSMANTVHEGLESAIMQSPVPESQAYQVQQGPASKAVAEDTPIQRFAWSKYWFKLQNTTLYFYTDKESQSTSLRGQYYMYSVQSVRNVSSADGDFTFEIVMKNGKRKLLSAESADLRDVWVQLLWKSMQLPGPGRHDSACTWYDIPELIQRVSCSSADGQPVVVTDDNGLKDDVFEQRPGAAEAGGEESRHISDSDIYDVPRPQANNATLPYGLAVEGFTGGPTISLPVCTQDSPTEESSPWDP